MIRRIQLTLLMLFIGVWAMASDISVKNAEGVDIWYNFDESTKTASVTYKGYYSLDWEDEYNGKIVIPSKVVYQGTEYSVTSIGSYAFEDCKRSYQCCYPFIVPISLQGYTLLNGIWE